MPVSPSKDRLKNVTNVLAHLLDDYDIRLRPDFGGTNLIKFFIHRFKREEETMDRICFI